MPQRNVATNFTFEQQRAEINLLAQDFWTQKGTVDTAASTYLKHDGSNAFTGGTLAVPNAFTINANSGAGTLTISGNLNVTGTTTTVNTATLDVTDKNITIAKGNTQDSTADGAGITIDSATDITFNFVDAKDAWVSSVGIEADTFLKAPYGQFTAATTPTTGQGVEVNAPDANTGQIISYDRGNTAYKDLRIKGTGIDFYAGSTNAIVGGFHNTGLVMQSGKTIELDDTIVHSGDTDTKIRFPAADTVQFETAGSNRLSIDNNALFVQAGFPLAFLATSSDPSPNIKSGGTNNADLLFTTGTGNPTRVKITKSGNVGIGTGTDPVDRQLHVKSSGLIAKLESTTANALIMFATPTNETAGTVPNIGANDNDLEFTTGNLSRLKIHSGGKVTIGNDHAGAGTWDGDLVVANNNGGRISVGDTGSGERFDIAANGDINLYSYLNGDHINFHTTDGTGTVKRFNITTDGTLNKYHNATDVSASFPGSGQVNGVTGLPSAVGTPFIVAKDTGTGKSAAFAGTITASQLIATQGATTEFIQATSTNNGTRAVGSFEGKDGSGNAVTLKFGGYGDTGRGEIFTYTNHPLGFATNNAATQMVLQTDGSLTVGTTVAHASARLISDGNIKLTQATNNTRRIFALPGTGTYTLNSSGGSAIAFIRDGSNNDMISFETHAQGASHAVRLTIDQVGNMIPGADDAQDLGSSTKRWANVYTGDMHLNNMNTGGNEVDGSEGHWTMQEGADDLFLINRNTGKKYKFNLTEVS